MPLRWGEPPSNEATKSIIGLSLDKAIAVLFPLHRAQHQALISGYKQHYQTDTTATPLFADVEKVLLALTAQWHYFSRGNR